MGVTFSTRPKQVVLTRETQTDVWDLYIAADGKRTFARNGWEVASLPKIPSTKELVKVADDIQDDVVKLLALQPDSPQYRVQWWAIIVRVD